MQTGEMAPDVTVTIEHERVRLRDFVGAKRVVLYFYPKDSSPSCAMEARGFNALIEQFAAASRLVQGIVAKRVTFLIDTDGRIARVWDRVNPLTHPQDVLDAVRRLAQAA